MMDICHVYMYLLPYLLLCFLTSLFPPHPSLLPIPRRAIADMEERFPRINGGAEFLEEAPATGLTTGETAGIVVAVVAGVAGVAAAVFHRAKIVRNFAGGDEGVTVRDGSAVEAREALTTTLTSADGEAAAI
jgi:hypothetical protein